MTIPTQEERQTAEETLKYIHTRSPEYEKTKEALKGQFRSLEVRPELVYFRFIGHDDEFAVARVKFKTVATSDAAPFQNNVVDSIMVFHQENGVWKA